MSQIFLLSGAVHSGKTTRLSRWIKNQNNVDGILQPVIDAKRYFKHISSGETKLLEISKDSDQKDIIAIGNYKFSNDVFSWANDQLILSFQKNPEWLIVDEFGLLEMDNKGLEPAVTKVLNDINHLTNMNLLIVIRDYLISSFLNKFNLPLYDVLNLDL